MWEGKITQDCKTYNKYGQFNMLLALKIPHDALYINGYTPEAVCLGYSVTFRRVYGF